MSWRIALVALLTLTAVHANAAGCVNIVHEERDRGGIGGTGLREGTGGIGGTGFIDGTGTGGIGGTGRLLSLRTGIVGTITGFASICVNGLEVHYDPETPVVINGENATLAALAIGQTVSVQAAPGKQGLTTARIVVQHIITGPITQLGDAQRSMQVMGSDVLLSPETRGQLNGLKVGESVRISGLRNQDGHILASRVDPGVPGEPASISGRISRGNGLQIQGVALEARAMPVLPDTPVVARGRWNGRALVAEEVRSSPAEAVLRASDHVVLEAIVQRVHANGNFEADSRQVVVADRRNNAGEPVQRGDRVIASGRLDAQGQLISEKVEVFHSAQDKRERKAAAEAAKDAEQELEETEKDAAKAAREAAEDAQDAQEKASERAEKIAEDAAKDRLDQQREASRFAEKMQERADKIEKTERADKIDKPEKADKIEKAERPEKVEKPEKLEKPEKMEKPEKVERPEKIEKPERIERSGKD